MHRPCGDDTGKDRAEPCLAARRDHLGSTASTWAISSVEVGLATGKARRSDGVWQQQRVGVAVVGLIESGQLKDYAERRSEHAEILANDNHAVTGSAEVVATPIMANHEGHAHRDSNLT